MKLLFTVAFLGIIGFVKAQSGELKIASTVVDRPSEQNENCFKLQHIIFTYNDENERTVLAVGNSFMGDCNDSVTKAEMNPSSNNSNGCSRGYLDTILLIHDENLTPEKNNCFLEYLKSDSTLEIQLNGQRKMLRKSLVDKGFLD